MHTNTKTHAGILENLRVITLLYATMSTNAEREANSWTLTQEER